MTAAKYNTDTGLEGEHEPESNGQVLRNLKGISTIEAMDEVEIETLIDVQDQYLDRIDDDTKFTAAHICQMHHDWLRTVYTWAGDYRTVEMSKDGSSWPPAHRIHENMERLELGLLKKHTPFRIDTGDDTALLGLAAVHAELLLIHPFREGNGRLARWLADLMCLQAGLPQPDYGFTSSKSKQQKEAYLAAVIQGYECNYTPLATFFREALERATNE
jgi:cell filamentation protein